MKFGIKCYLLKCPDNFRGVCDTIIVIEDALLYNIITFKCYKQEEIEINNPNPEW